MLEILEGLQRSFSCLLQRGLPISIAQNVLEGKYFVRMAKFCVSSLLLHLPQLVCVSLQTLSVLFCPST